jgi:hypothetical protein
VVELRLYFPDGAVSYLPFFEATPRELVDFEEGKMCYDGGGTVGEGGKGGAMGDGGGRGGGGGGGEL